MFWWDTVCIVALSTQDIQNIKQLIGRDPTVVETHIFDTMWSEHCSYKSSKPLLKQFPIEAYIKPSFLPVILITFVAKIAPTAMPTTDIDIGSVESDFKGLIWDPMIPLKNTVTGAAVKLKIWLNVSVNKFLFIKIYIYQKDKNTQFYAFQSESVKTWDPS